MSSNRKLKVYKVPKPDEVQGFKEQAISDLVSLRYTLILLKYKTGTILLTQDERVNHELLNKEGHMPAPYKTDEANGISIYYYNEHIKEILNVLRRYELFEVDE